MSSSAASRQDTRELCKVSKGSDLAQDVHKCGKSFDLEARVKKAAARAEARVALGET